MTESRGDILVVEGDVDVRELACQYLGLQGYRVLGAGSGEEALASVLENGVNGLAVMTEFRLLDMSCLKLLRELINLGIDSTRIVVTTGLNLDEGIATALASVEIPPDQILRKPFYPREQLNFVLRSIFEESQ